MEEKILFPIEQDTLAAQTEMGTSGNQMTMLYIIITIVVSGLFVYWILSRYGPDLHFWLAERRRKKLESEKFYFQQFRKSSMKNNPAKTVQTLLAWIEKIGLGISLSALREASKDEQLHQEIDELIKNLYGPNSPSIAWNGESLYAAVKRFRIIYLKSELSIEINQLHPLNPV